MSIAACCKSVRGIAGACHAGIGVLRHGVLLRLSFGLGVFCVAFVVVMRQHLEPEMHSKKQPQAKRLEFSMAVATSVNLQARKA